MSTDPYAPPETDVRVAETLPPRPVLGVSLGFLFSFIGGIALSTLFSIAITNLLDADAVAAGESRDPTAQIRLITRLSLVQMFVGLTIAFGAGFISVRVSRSVRWRYLFLLIFLSTMPALLMMLQYDVSRSPWLLVAVVLQSIAMLAGGRIAMMKLRGQKDSTI